MTKRITFGILLLLAVLLLAGASLYLHYTSPAYLVTLLSNEDQLKRRWAVDQLVLKEGLAGQKVLELAMDPKVEPETRRLAIFILGEIKYREAKKDLVSFLKGPDEVLAGQAAYALGRTGDPAVAEQLISVYPAAGKGLKMRILSALGELATPDAVALLKQEAESAGDETVRDAARYQLQYSRLSPEEKNRRRGERGQ